MAENVVADPDKSIEERALHLKEYFATPEILKLVPKKMAAKHAMLPMELADEVLHIVMADPKNMAAIDEVRRHSNIRAIVPHRGPERDDLLEAIDRNYGTLDKVQDIVQEVHQERWEQGDEGELDKNTLAQAAEQAPIIKLVSHVIMKAVQERSSDIHFEPDEKILRVRIRKDGLLEESYKFEKTIENAILARVKIISGMDIAEKRKPQDGRISIMLESKKIDIRVSSLPTLYGENIVLRILDKTNVSQNLEELGMAGKDLEDFRKLMQIPNGILLVTGPTGSGKSTTLFAGICEITDVAKNIVTVEDPIEYDIDLVRQTQVHAKIGLTFANGLRTILRQDPDVVMVGEIRDTETAEIAVQAALTGHLVISTLHTNDASGAITRLIDMGVPPYLIASSVAGVMAQRLVRKICEHCKVEAKIPSDVLKDLDINPQTTFYEGKKCKKCNQTGYSGRSSIHELFVMTDEMRNLISKHALESELFALSKKQGMSTLREDGLEKAKAGVTTIEEVLKVTR